VGNGTYFSWWELETSTALVNPSEHLGEAKYRPSEWIRRFPLEDDSEDNANDPGYGWQNLSGPNKKSSGGYSTYVTLSNV
jgi:hypothetical protein